MRKEDTPKILFLVSPSLGIIDAWLPALWEIKHSRSKCEIVAVLPKSRSVSELNLEDTAIKIANKEVFDYVIFKDLDETWKFSPNLEAAHRHVEKRKYIKKIKAIPHKLDLFFSTTFFNKVFKAIFSFLSFFSSKTFRLSELQQGAKVICYDIHEERKPHIEELFGLYPWARKISYPHGIGVRVASANEPEYTLPKLKIPRKVFICSPVEKEFYIEKYGLQEKEVLNTYILRHTRSWLDKVASYSDEANLDSLKPYIFLISRPPNNLYFPQDRRLNSIKAIKSVAQQLNLNVIIRRHPKEASDTEYEDIFGRENQGKTWDYSNKTHPIILAKHAEFGICFFSGVSIDLIAINVPTIELLSLDGLHDEENLPRYFPPYWKDEKKRPVLMYRHMGFVLGAEDEEELLDKSQQILQNRGEVINQLKASYLRYFNKPKDSGTSPVSREILKDL